MTLPNLGAVDLGAILDALADRVVDRLTTRLPVASTAPPPAPLVHKRALAVALSVSPATVDRLVRSGMPFQAVGDAKRFDLAACRAWLAEQGQRPAAPPAPPASARVLRLEGRDPVGLAGVRLLSRPKRSKGAR
jgi:hypothetical protein